MRRLLEALAPPPSLLAALLTRCLPLPPAESFTVLFSYINGLPIPWRLAIFHHVWCSGRPTAPGLDFYGRDTEAVWFHLPVSSRRAISLGLNIAWVCHFLSLLGHLVFWSYAAGKTLPGALAQNVPFVLSLASQVRALAVEPSLHRCKAPRGSAHAVDAAMGDVAVDTDWYTSAGAHRIQGMGTGSDRHGHKQSQAWAQA